jgi:hypothetical protein
MDSCVQDLMGKEGMRRRTINHTPLVFLMLLYISMPPFIVVMPKLLVLHHMMALMKSGVNSTEKFY